MEMLVVINQILKLFMMIGLGYLLRRRGWIDEVFGENLNRFVLNVTMPAMILASVFKQQSTAVHLPSVVAACIILIAGLWGVAALITAILPVKKENKGLYQFMIMYPNVGFMGFPLMESIFGAKAILSTAIINMCFNMSLFTVGRRVMNCMAGRRQKPELRQLLSPGVIASLVAVVCYLLKLRVPQVIADTCEMTGSMTTPLAMILIGMTLAKLPFREVWNDYRVYLFALLIQLVIPVMLVPVLRMCIADELVRGITLIIIAMPVANSAVLFACEFHQDAAFAAKIIFISTLMSIISIPLLVYCFLLN